MRALGTCAAVFLFLFVAFFAFGQPALYQNDPPDKVMFPIGPPDNSQYVPEGLEAVKVGTGNTILIPKGAKLTRLGAQLILEGGDAYMVRRFAEMEERLMKLEKAQDGLKKEVEVLTSTLNKTGRNLP